MTKVLGHSRLGHLTVFWNVIFKLVFSAFLPLFNGHMCIYPEWLLILTVKHVRFPAHIPSTLAFNTWEHILLINELSRKQRASLVAQRVKHLPVMRETQVQSLGWEDPLEKEMATHSSILAWRIP